MCEVEDYSLDRVMADPDLVLIFREFLKDSFSSENLAFIVEIENYKDLWDQGASDEVIFNRANQIFNKYFSSESKYELNVSGSLVEELKEKMKHPTTIIFNRVQQSIFKLVETDSFPRFVKSEDFKKAVEEKKKKEKSSGLFKSKSKGDSVKLRLKSRDRSGTISLLEEFFSSRPSRDAIVERYNGLTGFSPNKVN